MRSLATSLWRIARSAEARRSFSADVKRALDRTRPSQPAASTLEEAPFDGGPEPEPPFLRCTTAEVSRWNAEWLRYLEREFEVQLEPYGSTLDPPELPADPIALLSLEIGGSPPLSLYCDRDYIERKRLMEIGCGCGNLGKHISRYATSYLGTDYSTLALKIARLVSPPNAAYVHLGDRDGLRAHFNRIDTVVGRYFWIHQNMTIAKRLLSFLEAFLVDGGRLYADFYWPNPKVSQGKVFSPRDPLSALHPSATFAYSSEDVREWVDSSPFVIVRELIYEDMQRRFVVLEKRGTSRTFLSGSES